MTVTVTVWRDDLGRPVELDGPARRVVSLVPSLTEAVAVSAPGRLVEATDWCTHPAGLAVTRVRGTKNPERARVAALAPHLVTANREENRKLDVARLREDLAEPENVSVDVKRTCGARRLMRQRAATIHSSGAS